MTARDKILNAVAANKPALKPLPDISFLQGDATDVRKKFIDMLTGIGGKGIEITDEKAIADHIQTTFTKAHRVVTTLPNLSDMAELISNDQPPHSLQNIDLAILKANFGVAENGAIWITESEAVIRVLPFITQHLAIVINVDDVVADMHAAYKKIGSAGYGYGAFIAGPSKTADIEQSLVLGAHGARTMTVFLVG